MELDFLSEVYVIVCKCKNELLTISPTNSQCSAGQVEVEILYSLWIDIGLVATRIFTTFKAK